MPILNIELVIYQALVIVLSLSLLAVIGNQFFSARRRRASLHSAKPLDETSRMIGVLQQMQMLMIDHPTASLLDLLALIQHLQQTYGPQTALESVIQSLVAEHLHAQYRRRVALRKQQKAVTS